MSEGLPRLIAGWRNLSATGGGGGGGVPGTRQVIAGTGLSGGGALSSDVTLNLAAANLTKLANLNLVTDKTADYPLTTSDSGGTFTNAGAAGAINFTLPTAASGLTFEFAVQAAQFLRVTAAAGDLIRIAEIDSAVAGFIRSNEVGGYFSIRALDATVWIARWLPTRTWLVDE